MKGKESKEFPALGGLVCGYFNQDYNEYGETFDEIVIVAKGESTRRQIDGLRLDIERFLGRYGEREEIVKKAFRRVFAPEMNFEG